MSYRCLSQLLGFVFSVCSLGIYVTTPAQAEEPYRLRLVNAPSVSPDGQKIAFSWLGEIWTAQIDGSQLTRLTKHPALDSQPLFSPDGSQIAFISARTGSAQVFVMPAGGGGVRQITYHSAGYQLADWYPDGKALLTIGARDHFHRDAERLIKIHVEERKAEEILADAAVDNAKLSPDGKRVLFNREGERWWRKGYRGERSAQVWMLDLESGEYKELLHEGVECMWPLWMPNGKGFYFTKGDVHGFDLWRYRFAKEADQPAAQRRVIGFDEDSIVMPAISRDGKTIVFRHLFDLYRYRPGEDEQPVKIDLVLHDDVELPNKELRRKFSDADEVAFTADGLEIAFIAGGDVWVMDTKLREPKRITKTDGYEEELLFANDGETLYFTSIEEGQTDIWKATRKDSKQYWWQNHEFTLEKVTKDTHVESKLKLAPNGKQLLYQQGRGDLAAIDLASGESKRLVEGFSQITFDISPDSRWIAYEKQDQDFNGDIWIAPLDGSKPPVNVSRHPDNDGSPKFSPDGKLLAFTGRRFDDEVDIYYVYLQEADHERTSRERKLEEALELMKKKRKAEPAKPEPGKPATESPEGAKAEPAKSEPAKADPDKPADAVVDAKKEMPGKKPAGEVKPVVIDLENIHERLRHISIPNSTETSLIFSPDSKKLAFAATVDGKRGWYTVQFPDELTPKPLTTTPGSQAVWSEKADGILCLQMGKPAKVDASGKTETYGFEVAQESSRSGWLAAGFEKAWVTMREVWYDERMGNRNWDEIRRKYMPVAKELQNIEGLTAIVELMLGELNGSHLGFTASGREGREVEGWADETAHLGVRFDPKFKGPGLLVRDVLPDGPADRETSKLKSGDVIVAIDGHAVDPALDLTTVLNGPLDRDIRLTVKRIEAKENAAKEEGKAEAAAEAKETEQEFVLRPITYARARTLLYDMWLEHNRKLVEKTSNGKLGYLHIRAMDQSSFHEFERQLYNVGYGRQGLVIDVRDNGGGSTTDLLLTALTQPKHAITVPRGGTQGYPQDRIVFASWSKPIIVLCNQNSYSNAEIFSHAIKTLKRGKVVGVTTAGGVVSTGAARINDVGGLRVPFRGWFLLDSGEDMEMNGCQPDVVLWPQPGELPQGIDHQLEKAVELLLQDVGEGQPEKKLKYATERE